MYLINKVSYTVLTHETRKTLVSCCKSAINMKFMQHSDID